MSREVGRWVAWVGVAGLVGGAAMPLRAEGPYKFVKIADNKEGAFSAFHSRSARITNRGVVVFRADMTAGGRGIFTSDGTGLTTIATTGEEFDDLDIEPDINDRGQVVFWSKLKGGAGERVLVGDGTTLKTMADTGPDSPFSGFSTIGGVAINNHGTVVFAAHAKEGGQRLVTSDGKKATELATTVGTRFSEFVDANGPDINDAGVVVFSPSTAVGGGQGEEVVVFGDGKMTTVADTSGSYAGFAQASMNNDGALVFAARLKAGGEQLLVASGSELKTVADTAGPFRGFGLVPHAINNKGKVAFRPTLATTVNEQPPAGIFTGADPVGDKVIQVGDKLFDSTVNIVWFNRGLNDAGQIVFYAQLEDGTRGIYRADPVAGGSQ